MAIAHNHQPAYSKVIDKISWRLLPYMFVLYIISYLDRINMSFAAGAMMRDLQFDDQVIGFGLGVFFFGYCLFGVPSNLILRKLGARRWIAVIMVLWGLVSVLMAFVPERNSFFLMRFLLGAAEAGFFPGMIYYLTRWYRKREHGMAVAKFMSAIPAASLLGAGIASVVLGMPAYLNLAPWKWLFIITGSPAIFFGISVWFCLTDGPQTAGWLTQEERTLVLVELQEEEGQAMQRRGGGAVAEQSPLQTIGQPRVWLFAALYFTLTLAMYGFQLWLPQIIANRFRAGDSETALWTIIPAVFQAVGMIVIAGHSDRTGERRWHLAGAAVTAACGLAVAAAFPGKLTTILGLCLTSLGIWGTVGPFWAMPTAYLSGAGAAAAATAIGLINSVGNLGGFAGPYFVGAIKKGTDSFSSSLIFMAASLSLAALLSFWAGREGDGAKQR
ncbi:MAG TPA: MFS transporter [Chroococcales cyanobacterium]